MSYILTTVRGWLLFWKGADWTVRVAAMQYDECTPDRLMLFRILALTGEKIEKAVDFQSREHETQVSEYLGCLACMSYTQQFFLVTLALPGGCTRVPFAHINFTFPPPKEKSRMKPR